MQAAPESAVWQYQARSGAPAPYLDDLQFPTCERTFCSRVIRSSCFYLVCRLSFNSTAHNYHQPRFRPQGTAQPRPIYSTTGRLLPFQTRPPSLAPILSSFKLSCSPLAQVGYHREFHLTTAYFTAFGQLQQGERTLLTGEGVGASQDGLKADQSLTYRQSRVHLRTSVHSFAASERLSTLQLMGWS